MNNVTVIKSPSRPVGEFPAGVNSANMYEVRIDDQYVTAFVNEEQAESVKNALAVAVAKIVRPLEVIASLWPDPGMCAELAPEHIGPNDGRLRADLLFEALNTARAALGKPTYPQPAHWAK